MNGDMGWQAALILCALVFGAIVWAYTYVSSRSEKFISNKDLYRYRITPRFNVGSDVK
jgi:hypothetical protein